MLDQLRRELGAMVFSAQYQQAPTVPEGNLIRLDWFGSYDGPYDRTHFRFVIQSWDTAATAQPTGDWSVGMTFGLHGEHWYLLDLVRERMEYPDLKRAVLAQKRAWRPDQILVEQASTGLALVSELRAMEHYDVIAIQPRTNKVDRMIACTAEIEAVKFLLPSEAPWLSALQSELRAFPMGRHDDMVDALSQFIEHQKLRRARIEAEYAPDGRRMRVERRTLAR